MNVRREKVLVISLPQLHDLSARSLPDLNNPVVVRLANHIALKTWPSAESALGKPFYMMQSRMQAVQFFKRVIAGSACSPVVLPASLLPYRPLASQTIGVQLCEMCRLLFLALQLPSHNRGGSHCCLAGCPAW